LIEDLAPLVLVHLGDRIPSYLEKNIEYLKSTRSNPIVLIVDDTAKLKARILRGLEVRASQEFEQGWQSSLRTDYRGGFWEKSKKRLFVLAEYILHQDVAKDIIHIEGDVWISPVINLSHQIIASRVSFPLFTNDRASGSIILFSSKKQVQNVRILRETLLKYPALSDMETLRVFLNDFPDIGFGLRSNPNTESKGFIFDAALLGMHLMGEDPRNRFGLYKKYADYSHLGLVGLSKMDFFVDTNGLFVSTENRHEEVGCLHIHSKSTKLFTKDWESVLHRLILNRKVNSGKEVNRFSIRGFCYACFDYLRLSPAYLRRKLSAKIFQNKFI